MTIESVNLVENGYVVNGSLLVPNAPTNRDYQAVQAWIAAGNTPEAAGEASLSEAKAEAAARVNRRIEQAKVAAGIVVGLPGMVAQYASNAFFVERWTAQGRPSEPDPALYPTAEAERQGFTPVLSLAEMLATWEAMWNGMNAANAGMMLARRRALEAVKAAETTAEVEAALAELEVELSTVNGQ